MQKGTCLFLLGFLFFSGYGQTRLIPGEQRGKSSTFIVEPIMNGYIVISNKDTINYKNMVPVSPQIEQAFNRKNDMHVDNNAIGSIVYKVLEDSVNTLRKNKEELSLELTFDIKGNLIKVDYCLHANTLVTLQQIEEIDHRMKTNIKANFTGTWYKRLATVPYWLPSFKFDGGR